MRVDLRRATDVVVDALDLMEATGEIEAKFFVLKFKVAFKQLTVDPSEKAFSWRGSLRGLLRL